MPPEIQLDFSLPPFNPNIKQSIYLRHIALTVFWSLLTTLVIATSDLK